MDIGQRLLNAAHRSASTGTIVLEEHRGVPIVFRPPLAMIGRDFVYFDIDGKSYVTDLKTLPFTVDTIIEILEEVGKEHTTMGEI